MSQSGRKCVWCGGRANSKEHVYPQWLRSFRGPSSYIKTHGGHQASTPRLVARFNDKGEWVEYPATRGKVTPNLHEVQVKVVCRECNSGWMSRMEVDIEPLVRRLVSDIREPISTDEQHRLAAWVHKTFLMYDLWEELPDRRYRAEDYRSFYDLRQPAAGVRIFLAASRSPFANFAMWSDSRSLIPRGADGSNYVAQHGANCGSSYFAVDGLVMIEHWFAPHFPTWDRAGQRVLTRSRRSALARGAVEIWPQPNEHPRWASKVLTTRGTNTLRLCMFDALKRAPALARRVPPPE